MLKAVLFDFDGTLHNREATVEAFVRSQYSRYPELRRAQPEAWVERFLVLDDHGYVWKDKVYVRLLDEFAIDGVTAEELVSDYVGGISAHCVGMPDMAETLGRLRSMGLKLGLVTNGIGDVQLANIRSLGMEELFYDIAISGLEGVAKPDPGIFRRALERLGVRPEEAVYVGDHPVNDMQACLNAGMMGVWMQNLHFPLGNGKVNGIIGRLSELVEWLSNLTDSPIDRPNGKQ